MMTPSQPPPLPWGMPLDVAQVTFVADDDDDETEPREEQREEREQLEDKQHDDEVTTRGLRRKTIRSVRETKQPYNEAGERVYCVCRGVDNGRFMICCDVCKDWYHGACVNITERMGQTIKFYECPYCVQAKNDAVANETGSADGQNEPATRSTSSTASRRSSASTKRPSLPLTSASAASIPKSTSSSTKLEEPDVGPTSMAWIHDKTRSLVRKSFGDLLRNMQEDLKAEGIYAPAVAAAVAEGNQQHQEAGGSWLDITELAGNMEDALFDFTADGEKGHKRYCGEKYKSKFRSLQFNLKDKKNSTLRTRLLQGLLPATSLVRLEAKDLANDEIKAKSEEIRILNLHNSIKPKEVVDVVYKKTHKGDEEVRTESMAAAITVSDASNKKKQPTTKSRRDEYEMDEDDEDYEFQRDRAMPSFSGSGATANLLPKEIARIVAEAEAAARAPIKITAPAKIESLDDLLAKMDGGDSPSSSSGGVKRRGYDNEDFYGDSKKGRVEEAVPAVAATGGWDNLKVADSWGSFDGAGMMDGDDSWMRDDDFTVGGEEANGGFSPKSPKDSPPPENTDAVWSGMIRMPQVAKFNGTCRQIAGRPVGSAVKSWEALLPPSVMVEGRIDIRAAEKYIDQQKLSSSKEVIAVEFLPDAATTTTLSPSNGIITPNAEGGFQELLDYFLEKARYAVVGGKYVSVRDMYLVPVKAGRTVPQTITVLSKFNVVDKTDTNRLFGVMVLDKAFFATISTLSSAPSASSKPQPRASASTKDSTYPAAPAPAASSATQQTRREPARDPRIRAPQQLPMPPPPPAPVIPTLPPWAAGLSTFAQTQQQHAPALPLGAVPPAPSATALALLMQLQRQQQAAAATVAPPVPQGIAGLLSQIQAANALQQQQKQQQQSYSSSASLYGYPNGSSGNR
ncbi:transcription factor S-II, central domain-containing protein [Obelidium mucronatum]|nr:transcription factor S-II, central domain-containing protein [Obelidium mucronatum]